MLRTPAEKHPSPRDVRFNGVILTGPDFLNIPQMSRPIRLGTIAQLPYDVAVKREAAYDQDPVTQLLGPGPTPSALWRHRINEEADEGKDE